MIEKFAAAHGLPPALVKAVVEVESGGNPWATRYEPAFFRNYVENARIKAISPCSTDTEKRLRATSFGPMQVMGQTARELGFDRPFLTELCDPATGLEHGCRYLAKQVERYRDKGLDWAVAAYNAGTARKDLDGVFLNRAYVDKIREAGGFE